MFAGLPTIVDIYEVVSTKKTASYIKFLQFVYYLHLYIFKYLLTSISTNIMNFFYEQRISKNALII